MKQMYEEKNIIRYYLTAAACWSLLAAMLGLLSQVNLATQIFGADSMFAYGRIRPLFNMILLFGAVLSFLLGIGAAIVSDTKGAKIKYPVLGGIAFIVHHLGLLYGIIGLHLGLNTGREYGEFSWFSMHLIMVGLIFFIAMLLTSVQGLEKMTKGMLFLTLSLVGSLLVIMFGNIALPYGFFLSVSFFSGFQDAAAAEFYRAGLLGFLVLMPLFAILYHYVPIAFQTDLFSHRIANIQAIVMLGLFPLAGGAGLALSPTPVCLQVVGCLSMVVANLVVIAGVYNLYRTIGQSAQSGDAAAKAMKLGCMLLGAYALIRVATSPRPVQEYLGMTSLNTSDLTVDIMVYFLLIAFGGTFYAIRRTLNASYDLPGAATWALLAGAVLVILASVAGGVTEMSKLTSLDDKGLPVTDWAGIFQTASLFRMIMAAGITAILVSVFLSTLQVWTAAYSNETKKG